MKVEFFHDVICSFCFPMSYKMRQIARQLPEVEVVHRSFVLAWTKEDLIRMFGSLSQAKTEILHHWENANLTDPLKRFNPTGMAKTTFDFPTSKYPLLAAKAAGIIGGESDYWDVFDALQERLFIKNQDISNLEVIYDVMKTTNIDFLNWKRQFEAEETELQVKKDMEQAIAYRISSVPTLIMDGVYQLNGSQPIEDIISDLQSVSNTMDTKASNQGDSCRLDGGAWQCD